MANDRIWVVCPKCEEMKLLFKYYPPMPPDFPNYNGYMYKPDEMEEFLNKHLRECHGAQYDLGGSPGVVLITDSMTKSGSSGKLAKEIMEQLRDLRRGG